MLIITGQTAIGKTKLAEQVALTLNAEIISADSMQIYKHMDIGTAKDLNLAVKQHMIDILEPSENYSVFNYTQDSNKIISELKKSKKEQIVCGGTGMYIDSFLFKKDFGGDLQDNPELLKELNDQLKRFGPEFMHEQLRKIDPESAQKIHVNNERRVIRAIYISLLSSKKASEQSFLRINENCLMFVLEENSDFLKEKIKKRVQNMMQLGLEQEIKNLISNGIDFSMQSMKGIGYKEWEHYISGNINLQNVEELIVKNTQAYAKRQNTWFNNKKYNEIKITISNKFTFEEKINFILSKYKEMRIENGQN